MNIKRIDLAGLKTAYDKSRIKSGDARIQEYMYQGKVQEFSEPFERIEFLEKFQLPEITMLICMSDELLKSDLGKKYRKIAELYRRGTENIDLGKFFHYDVEIIRSEIIGLADDEILDAFCNYYDEQNDKKELIEKDLKKKEKRLSGLKEELRKLENESKEQPSEEMQEKIASDLKTNEDDSSSTDSDIHTNVIQENESDIDHVTLENKQDVVENVKQSTDQSEDKNEIHQKQELLDALTDEVRIANDELEKIDKRLLKAEPVKYMLLVARKQYDETCSSKRERLYAEIDLINMSDEEKALRQLISNNSIDEDFRQNFQKRSFSYNFGKVIEKPQYMDHAVKVITCLYHEGLIDLFATQDENELTIYAELLCDYYEEFQEYLICHFPQTMERIKVDDDYEALFELALKHDIKNSINKEPLNYQILWSCIEDHEIWKWIIEYMVDHYPYVHEEILAAFVFKLLGRSLDAFINACEEKDLKFTALIKAMLENDLINNEFLMTTYRRLEKNNRKLETHLKRAEAVKNNHPTIVYRALSGPEEELEYLAVNIANSKQEIKNEIIGAQLMDIVSKMRDGLSELQVYPVEQVQIWKSQKEVLYDKQRHAFPLGHVAGAEIKNVRIDTVGFCYKNGTEEISYPAKVTEITEGE